MVNTQKIVGNILGKRRLGQNIDLDIYWEYQKGMKCPFCGGTGLWYDTHPDQDATHCCKKCGETMMIVSNVSIR